MLREALLDMLEVLGVYVLSIISSKECKVDTCWSGTGGEGNQ